MGDMAALGQPTKTMNLQLHFWSQSGPSSEGKIVIYDTPGVSHDMSFPKMLDVVNEVLTENGNEPIAFDRDCREGTCGSCSMMINGIAGSAPDANEILVPKYCADVAFDAATCIGCGAKETGRVGASWRSSFRNTSRRSWEDEG